jgi:ribose 5-phosphate isomerase B
LKVVLGADHAGFRLKEEVKRFLLASGLEVEDLGTHSEEPVDYPDVAEMVAGKVARGEGELGILICGTGIGQAIAANKVPGVRAALANDVFTARLAREHNDANVLALGARVVGVDLALDVVRTFLGARFQGGRHAKRVEKIRSMEARYMGESVRGGRESRR